MVSLNSPVHPARSMPSCSHSDAFYRNVLLVKGDDFLRRVECCALVPSHAQRSRLKYHHQSTISEVEGYGNWSGKTASAPPALSRLEPSLEPSGKICLPSSSAGLYSGHEFEPQSYDATGKVLLKTTARQGHRFASSGCVIVQFLDSFPVL